MTRSSVLVRNLAAFSVWLLVPYFLARVPAYSLAESGAILATAAAGAALAAPIGARLAGRRISAQQLAITGAAAIGLLFLGAWTEQTPDNPPDRIFVYDHPAECGRCYGLRSELWVIWVARAKGGTSRVIGGAVMIRSCGSMTHLSQSNGMAAFEVGEVRHVEFGIFGSVVLKGQLSNCRQLFRQEFERLDRGVKFSVASKCQRKRPCGSNLRAPIH